jgi:TPR repeat protein
MIHTRKISTILTGLAFLLQTVSFPVLSGCRGKVEAEVDRRCQELADSLNDSQKVASGVPFRQINISEALPLCERAAARQPQRLRYQFLYGRVLQEANRFAEAATQYSMARKAGYSMASNNLGTLYENGQGVPQNFEQAARLYREAAEAPGNAAAYFNLGLLYRMGRGVPQDWREAANWYQKAGDAGYADGYANLAALYALSDPPNYADAAKWAKKAAQGGSAVGSATLGSLYQSGSGIAKDPVLAKHWYEEAAKKGFPDAMYSLGLMYETGEGLPPDPETAAQWMYKAAKQGHNLAQLEIADMFYNGLGTKKDDRAAFDWYLRAAKAGSNRAQHNVAVMYHQGEVVTKDESEAVAWYRKAADQGDVNAMNQLGLYLSQGTGVARNEAEAMQCGSGKPLIRGTPQHRRPWAMDIWLASARAPAKTTTRRHIGPPRLPNRATLLHRSTWASSMKRAGG